MSEKWQTFKEEEPREGQKILVCDQYYADLPFAFKFHSTICDKSYFLVYGRDKMLNTYSAKLTVWRDMVELPGAVDKLKLKNGE